MKYNEPGLVYDPTKDDVVRVADALEYMNGKWLHDHCSTQTAVDLIEVIKELRHACLAAVGYIKGQSILTEKGITETLTKILKPCCNKQKDQP